MGFQRDAPPVPVKAHQIAVVAFKRHRHTEIPDVFLDDRAGVIVRLQIAPEKPLAHGGFVGGKPFYGDVHRLLEDIGIYVLF